MDLHSNEKSNSKVIELEAWNRSARKELDKMQKLLKTSNSYTMGKTSIINAFNPKWYHNSDDNEGKATNQSSSLHKKHKS